MVMSESDAIGRQMVLIEHGQEQQGKDDFYTPPYLFEKMGLRFDLDVCAPPGGVPWVPADRYFTKAEDGLSQPWNGRVWMNPPYSKPTPWVRRFIEHRHGIALLPFAKAAWCDAIWDDADGVINPGFAVAGDFVTSITSKPRRESAPIQMPVFLAAYGDECVAALYRLGVVRLVGPGGDDTDGK